MRLKKLLASSRAAVDLVLNLGVPQYNAKDINCLGKYQEQSLNGYVQGYATNLVMVLYLKVVDDQAQPLDRKSVV